MNTLMHTKFGMMIVPSNDIYQGRALDEYGLFSEGEVMLFKKLLNPGDIVVEVGANIGTHTLALSKIVGPTGLVVAFEPVRNNYYTLCGNVSLNNLNNVRALQYVVNDGSSYETFVPEIDPEKTNNFGGIELGKNYKDVLGYNVKTTTLDNFVTKECHLLKIDVEGMEISVLQGARKFIEDHKPILYVENDREENSAKLFEIIEEMGYTPYWHTPKIFPEHHEGDNPSSLNLLCLLTEHGSIEQHGVVKSVSPDEAKPE